MTETVVAGAVAPSRTPWHLWAVGILSLLWYAAGAYTIVSAQRGTLAGISPDEAAYYAAQATWFAVVTDIALVAGIVGSLALLLRSRWAVPLYGLMIAAIAITACYDLAAGTSRMYVNSGALVATLLIWLIAVLNYWYAATMRKRGVLR